MLGPSGLAEALALALAWQLPLKFYTLYKVWQPLSEGRLRPSTVVEARAFVIAWKFPLLTCSLQDIWHCPEWMHARAFGPCR